MRNGWKSEGSLEINPSGVNAGMKRLCPFQQVLGDPHSKLQPLFFKEQNRSHSYCLAIYWERRSNVVLKMKNDEPKLCSNCVLMDVYRGDSQKDASSLKVCIRLRALALRDGRLFLCKPFNYGFGVTPQTQPKPKTEEQAPLLMFTERHHTGDSWKVLTKSKTTNPLMRIETHGNRPKTRLRA